MAFNEKFGVCVCVCVFVCVCQRDRGMRDQGDRNREEKGQRESNISEKDFEICLTTPSQAHFQIHVCMYVYIFMLHRLITDNTCTLYMRHCRKRMFGFTDLLKWGAWRSLLLGAFPPSCARTQPRAHT